MDRAQKVKLIDQLHQTLKASTLVVVTRQKGLTVAEVTDLRRQMRAAGAGFKVAKNRLARRALDGTKFQHLSPFFKGSTAFACSQDPVAEAKVAFEFAKKNEKLEIVGGGLDERVLDVAEIKALLERILRRHPRVRRRPARDDRDLLHRLQPLRRNFQLGEVQLLPVRAPADRVGQRAWLLVDFLEHEVWIAFLRGAGEVPGDVRDRRCDGASFGSIATAT